MTTAADLADLARGTDYADLDDDVAEETKKRVLDAVAIATGAIDADPVERLRAAVRELDHEGASTVWGSADTSSPELATALNGAMVRYLDFMDAYLLTGEVPHPSNNVAPAVVAAEYNDRPGAELLAALAVAYEIHYHLGKEAPLMDRGWDHGTYVTFSASAAAGRLFGLDRDALTNAIGIAGVGHNALRVARTGDLTMWKGLSAANAARNAVYAVVLAKHGVEGPTDVLEGDCGWQEVVSGPFEARFTPGEAVLETMTKKYMAGTVAQTALDALAVLLAEHDLDGRAIETIEVETYHRAKVIMGGTGQPGESGDRHQVANREQADHSLPYVLAALALDGELGHDQYALERIRRDDVQDLLARVTVREDPDLTARYEAGEMPALVTVTTVDGEEYAHEQPYFEGHPATPMSWEGLADKLAAMADGVYTDEEQAAIVETVRTLDERPTSDLVALLRRD